MARLKNIVDNPGIRALQEAMKSTTALEAVDTSFLRTHMESISHTAAFARTMALDLESAIPAITDFPAPAFNELLDHSGLRVRTWPGPARQYGEGLEISPENRSEDVPETNRSAYDIIYRLE